MDSLCKILGKPRGKTAVEENGGALHLFLNKTELWDCRGFLLSAFETEIREHLGLRPEVGVWGPTGGFGRGVGEERGFRESKSSVLRRPQGSQDPQTSSRKPGSQPLFILPRAPSSLFAKRGCALRPPGRWCQQRGGQRGGRPFPTYLPFSFSLFSVFSY